MTSIAVVHLVRAGNGAKPLLRFLNSYEKYTSGIEHDFIIIFKGYVDKKGIIKPEFKHEMDVCETALSKILHKKINIEDIGYDIDAYLYAVISLDYEYFCFINSYGIILENFWLKKLYNALGQPDVGLVGTTGSYESLYNNFLMLESEYFSKPKKPTKLFSILYHFILYKILQLVYRLYFDPFPNYHIRTNSFMISSNLLRKIRSRNIRSKLGAHKFESGRNGLSKKILKMGKKIVVVGRNGTAYDKEDWWLSNTFRHGEQENLLIADNQTNRYQNANRHDRFIYSKRTWGRV